MTELFIKYLKEDSLCIKVFGYPDIKAKVEAIPQGQSKKSSTMKPKKKKEEKSIDMSKTSIGSNGSDSTLSSSLDMSKTVPRTKDLKEEF